MRFAGLSLVSLLVVAGIIVLVQSLHTVPMLKSGAAGRRDAQQLAGQDASGMRTTDSITFSPVYSGSTIKGVQVATVIVGGPMNAYFGLLPGDVVTGIAGMPDLDFLTGNDPDAFNAFVLEAYQRRQTLLVDRPGVGSIELPRDAAMTAPAGQQPYAPLPAAPPTGATTPTPAPTPAPPTERPQTLWDKFETQPAETH